MRVTAACSTPIRWSKTKRKETGGGQITVEGLEYQARFEVFPPDPRFKQRADGVSIVLLKGEQLEAKRRCQAHTQERSMRSVRPERPKPLVNGFIGRLKDMGRILGRGRRPTRLPGKLRLTRGGLF